MGQSAYGRLMFGIRLEKDMDQPWDTEEFEGDEEEWWRFVRGFVSSYELPFDEDGNWKPGFNTDDPRVTAYYDERSAWDTANPFPYALERIGYSEEPSHFLACRGLKHSAEWSETIPILPSMLAVIRVDEECLLMEFCRTYEIVTEGNPGWYLTSFYG